MINALRIVEFYACERCKEDYHIKANLNGCTNIRLLSYPKYDTMATGQFYL